MPLKPSSKSIQATEPGIPCSDPPLLACWMPPAPAGRGQAAGEGAPTPRPGRLAGAIAFRRQTISGGWSGEPHGSEEPWHGPPPTVTALLIARATGQGRGPDGRKVRFA